MPKEPLKRDIDISRKNMGNLYNSSHQAWTEEGRKNYDRIVGVKQ